MTFDIADEFRITEEMEDGRKHMLSDDAYIKVRSFQSKNYMKGTAKLRDKYPDMESVAFMLLSMAECLISDVKNVSIDGKLVENTTESKLKMLKYQAFTDTGLGPVALLVKDAAELSNFPDAGNALKRSPIEKAFVTSRKDTSKTEKNSQNTSTV